MKKHLLTSFYLIIVLGVSAQNNKIKYVISKDYLTKNQQAIEPAVPHNYYPQPVSPLLKQNTPVNVSTTNVSAKNPCGNSENIFGSIIIESNNLNSNQDLGVVLFTHRTCKQYVDSGIANSGDVNATFATDCITWDSTKIITNPASTNAGVSCRYPTGAIFNPPGNTNIANAVAFASGPYHIGGTWTGSYFASGKLDGTGYNFTTMPGNAYSFARTFSQVTDDGNYYVLGNSYDDQNAPTVIMGYPIDKMSYDWNTNTSTISQSIISNNGIEEHDDGGIAFSQDGSLGYFAVIGRDTSGVYPNYVSQMPIIWKSTNQGITWTREPVFDFSLAHGMDTIIGNDTTNLGTRLPVFDASNGFDMTVDSHGDVHILSVVYSAFNITAGNIDSIYSTQHIVDVYGSGNDWAAHELAILETYAGTPTASSPWSNAGVGITFDARLQIGRTTDGSKVFYAWVDSDPNLTQYNEYPDLHVAAMDVITYLAAPDQNVTAATPFAANNFLMYLSSTILENGSNYEMPMVTTTLDSTFSIGWIYSIQHQSVCGVSFSDPDFTINVNSPRVATQITTNSHNGTIFSLPNPNPFHAYTAIDVKVASPVVISLEVANCLGQIVKTMDAKNYPAGIHKIEINASDLTPGVYFYTIKFGNELVTGKMIVQ